MQNLAPPTIRYGHLALNLTVVLVWLANSIHSRPADDNGARALLITALPLTNNHNSRHLFFLPTAADIADDLEVPYCPFNCVFLKGMMAPPQSAIFRLTHGEIMDDKCCLKYFGLTFEALRAKRVHVGILTKDTVTAKNIPTMKARTTSNLNVNPPIDPYIARLPSIRIPVPGRGEYGPDMPYNEYHVDLPEHHDSHLRITKLLNQFASDIMQKCGNSKDQHGDTSHCKIAKFDRRGITIDFFNDTTLSDAFWRVQWRYQNMTSPTDWEKIFSICFPHPKHVLPVSSQNWRKMQYYTTYKDIVDASTSKQALDLRRHLWHKFKTLAWLPAVESDRVWRYEPKDGYTCLPNTHTGSAPRIVFRDYKDTPRWESEEPEVNAAAEVNAAEVNAAEVNAEEEEEEEESQEDENSNIFTANPHDPPRRNIDQYFHRREEEEESSEVEDV